MKSSSSIWRTAKPGGVRLGKPDKIVFVAKDAKIDRRFQGWSYAADLLPQLLAAHPQYARSLHSAWAAARQWELVEPQDTPDPAAIAVAPPVAPPWVSGRLANARSLHAPMREVIRYRPANARVVAFQLV